MATIQPLLTCARRALLRQHLPTTLPRSARSFTSAHLLRTSHPPPSHELTREEAEAPGAPDSTQLSECVEGEARGSNWEEEHAKRLEKAEEALERAELEEAERMEEEELEGEEGELEAPPNLLPLYDFLTSPTTLAGEVLLPHTVQFFDTRAGSAALEAQEAPEGAAEGWENAVRMSGMLGAGTPAPASGGSSTTTTAAEVRRVRKSRSDASLPESGEVFEGAKGETFGPAWEWVGVVQVKGRGRGVVGRADGVIRRWLLQNPLSPTVAPVTIPNPKTPRIDPDADWSIVPIKGTRICLNLLTEEGRVRWRLEEMWGGKGKRGRGRLYSPGA